jgi:hypothetical protein
MPNKPKKIYTKLHKAFLDIVQDEGVGTFLFKFYRNYLDFGGSPTLYEKQKLKILNLNDRRTKHLKTVIEKYDLEHIVNSAAIIIEKVDSGIVNTNTVRPGYFDKVLLNKSSQNKDKDSSFSYD